MTPEQEKSIQIFDEIWKKWNWLEVNETEKQLSRMTVEDLLKLFTI